MCEKANKNSFIDQTLTISRLREGQGFEGTAEPWMIPTLHPPHHNQQLHQVEVDNKDVHTSLTKSLAPAITMWRTTTTPGPSTSPYKV